MPEIVRISNVTVPKGYSVKKNGLTQSMLTGFLTCRRRAVLGLNHWYYPGETMTVYGTIVHEMLDRMHKLNQRSSGRAPAPVVIKKWLRDYHEALVKEAGESGEVTDGYYKSLSKSTALASATLPTYVNHYPQDWSANRWIDVEREFAVLWQGYLLRGKIDAVFEDKKGQLWLMEHKTKSQISEEMLQLTLTFNFQNLFYINAAEALYKRPVVGVLYNIMRVPGTKLHVGEPEEEWAARVAGEVKKNPKHYFLRYELFYSKRDVDNFRRELHHKLLDFNDMLTGKARVYGNETACERPYKCRYLEACSRGDLCGYQQSDKWFPELSGETPNPKEIVVCS